MTSKSKNFEAGLELVNRYATALPSSHIYSGYVWPGVLMSADRLNAVKNITFRPNDILIASYPKSGTTWVSELVSALVMDGDLLAVRSRRQHERVPWLELDTQLRYVRVFHLWQAVQKMFGWESTTADRGETEDDGRPRIWFTHLPIHMLPKDVLDGKCKLIYVGRNPKDNMVSFFHFHQMARFLGTQTALSWNNFFDLYLDGNIYSGSWFKHVQSYWNFTQERKENTLFLKYEDLKQNLSFELSRVCDLLGVAVEGDTRRAILDHCSFESMKENDMANRQGIPLFNQNISKFMRKGVVGDWKEYLTVAQNDLFDQVYAAKMQNSDLSFQFTLDDKKKEEDKVDDEDETPAQDTHL